MQFDIDRRRFLERLGGAAATGSWALQSGLAAEPEPEAAVDAKPYTGPNVIIVRFGGGVRRRETIDPAHTYAPYFCHELSHEGVLFPLMNIATDAPETSHGEGTLNILTGIYDKYHDVGNKFLGARFEARVPTLFEYLRKAYAVPEHQTLIINGEDRTDEEFYSFSNHHLFGARFRSNVLSLYRFKTFLLAEQIAEGRFKGEELAAKEKQLTQMRALDHRPQAGIGPAPEIDEFWRKWRAYYGDSGLRNPRGDQLLTELALWALARLRPRLIMINYNDCDYVHWGILSHYTRAISIMDRGLRQLVKAVEADEHYRDNTIFAIVPDCGRDSNPFMSVPCQHHFNSPSARKIFALFVGPGIDRGRIVDKPVEQNMVAATIAHAMGIRAEFADGSALSEAFA